MGKLHKNIQNGILEPSTREWHGGFSYSKATSFCPPALVTKSLSKETLNALQELGTVLKRIHKRMLSEGYEFKNGVIRKALS